MIEKLPIADCRWPIESGTGASSRMERGWFQSGGAALPRRRGGRHLGDLADRQVSPTIKIINRQAASGNAAAFSLVELLVAMTLLSLIVLALMAVFSSTQRAFRASITQTDVLEGSRAAMDLMATDLRNLTPSDGVSNYLYMGAAPPIYGAVNFFATNNTYYYAPLVQSLPGSTAQRTNLLQYFFVLGRNNTQWTGAGYIVNAGSTNSLYPLYRFYAETNVSANPVVLYWNFLSTIYNAEYSGQWTNLSHVMDGVVHLVVRAYDHNGVWLTNGCPFYGTWLTNGYAYWQTQCPRNVWFSPPYPPYSWGETGFSFYSNAVPAAVELQMGVLEDRAMQRAESLGIPGQPPLLVPPEWQYLQAQSGRVHVFRERVAIPNVDPSAYP